MSSEKQYIELYQQYHSVIDEYGAPILNKERQAALNAFLESGFPSGEKYHHTNVDTIFGSDYGMNLKRIDFPIDPYALYRCEVPNLSTLLYFLDNDRFFPCPEADYLKEKGVILGSLKEMSHKYPELIQSYYNKLARGSKEGTTHLNTLFAQDGFFLFVPKGVKMEKTIQLIQVMHGSIDLLANRRLLIVIEDHAEAKLLLCDHTNGEKNFLANQVTEIFVGQGAHFEMYELEESSARTIRFNNNYVEQRRDSKVTLNSSTLHNGQTRNNHFVVLKEEGAELYMTGMAIGDQSQRIDNYTYIDHQSGNCQSNQLYKYVLDDQAVGSFYGQIHVAPGANGTSAMQTNRNLCSSALARMYTTPQLEIYTDDVKCSHGTTTGQLDLNALFYMQARGIGEKEAKLLLTNAFMSDIIDSIALEPLKDRLRMLVEQRFRGELSKCGNCAICK